MADDEYEEEVTENPRHQAQRDQNQEGGKFGYPGKGISGYLKPKKQVYRELNEALDEEIPSVKQRRD